MRRGKPSVAGFAVLVSLACASSAQAQTPEVVDQKLGVRTAASSLTQPVSMAFIGPRDALVLEKASGQVKRVVNGTVQGTVLDLAVNSNSERGLLGIALHPNFASNGFVYLFWSESNTGADTNSSTAIDVMGNRVDRFRWNGSTLTFDREIIRFRAFQQDAGQAARGNHNGGVLRFGSDGKLYAIVGDTGRRGQTQNLVNGPFGPGIPDDQFGGPAPDDAHRTGVIVRLERRRHGAHRQPVLRGRGGDRRRGRRERPEAVRLRHPQLVRHGRRPRVGRFVGAGERRRLVQRGQPRRARHELRLGPDHGAGIARRAVQGDRDHDGPDQRPVRAQRLLRPAADPLAADQHRRHAAGGALAPVHAPRRALQRPRAELEVRARARRHRLPRRPRARAAVRGRPVHGRLARLPRRAATCSASS